MTSLTCLSATAGVSIGSLERMVAIARRAGDAVMALYGRPIATEQKGDMGPVTDADRASHRVILEELAAWDDRVPIVSEEMEVADYETRRQWARFWIVDPLDGTKEFLARNGEFTINIALVDQLEPVLGVVFAPALQTVYFGGRGLGSWRQEHDSAPERLYSTPAPPGRPLRVIESRSHRCDAHETFLETLQVAERVQAGSSLKFCRLAEGRADVYPRLTPIMAWDAAAGDCVYRYSGVDGERTSPLRYNQPDLRIPSFVLGL